ncbi:MAG: hypothetical protein R6U98_25330 [Pirellulaceae bacterium]
MPKWLDEYAGRQDQRGGDVPRIDPETVLGFLRSLRDPGAPAWQRPQAARALEWYQSLVLDRGDVDFAPFKRKLGELAARERRTGGGRDGEGGIPGEGLPGKLDPSEPEAVRALRARMRVLHRPKSTEDAYAGWLLRKGQQDRVTVLPESVVEPLRHCIETARAIHREDVQDGHGRVYLPFALRRKYPGADREIGWQYVFPARQWPQSSLRTISGD